MKARLASLNTLYHGTRSGVIWMANGILSDLASEELASCVSVNPLEPPPHLLSVKQALEDGDLVVYAPSGSSPIADMVGRCLKSKFFEFAFQRANKVRPFFYVVDEAHRFLTAGSQDGEQSLLDRCRAYRTGVVLATQSIASMIYRLGHVPGGGKSALQIILNIAATRSISGRRTSRRNKMWSSAFRGLRFRAGRTSSRCGRSPALASGNATR
jgi:hypothetical protein